MRQLRNILNTLFVFAALAGMFIYYKGNTSVGGTIIIVAIAIKFVEVCLRIINKE